MYGTGNNPLRPSQVPFHQFWSTFSNTVTMSPFLIWSSPSSWGSKLYSACTLCDWGEGEGKGRGKRGEGEKERGRIGEGEEKEERGLGISNRPVHIYVRTN